MGFFHRIPRGLREHEQSDRALVALGVVCEYVRVHRTLHILAVREYLDLSIAVNDATWFA